MDKKKRVIFFSSILGVLILVGLYVMAVDHLSNPSVTTTGETDNLANWTKLGVNDTFNFTIPFQAGLIDNITQIHITLVDGGEFDMNNYTNLTVLMDTSDGNLNVVGDGANFSCLISGGISARGMFICENSSSVTDFIAGSTLYLESIITVNGSAWDTLGTDNATQVQFNISTLDTNMILLWMVLTII